MKEIIISFRLSEDKNDLLNESAKSIGLTRTAYIKKKLFQDEDKGWASAKILMPLGEITTAVNKLKYENEDEELTPYISDIERGLESIWQIL